MKVILLQDVAKIGRRYEIVETPDGYAMNMLIPKGMAKPATPENVKQLSTQTEKIAAEQANATEAFGRAIEALEGKTVAVPAELNEQGHMFAALKAEEIVSALEAEGVHVESTQILFGDAIKEQGEHTIHLVQGDKKVPLTISVEAK